jgi:trk system potassium uptake protein TrkH
MRFLAVQRVLAGVIALSGLIMLPPLALSLVQDDGLAPVFGQTLLVSLGLALLLWLPARRAARELRVRDGFMAVTLTWLAVSAICALPFLWGPTALGPARAYFEAASGLTTTGATMLSGLDALPKSLLLYRQLLCFVGGMGAVILAVAVLPVLRIGGSQLFRAEMTGPVQEARLAPRIAETARSLWLVYVGLAVLCGLAYWSGGMGLFDAVGHAFSTVSTSAFSTHDQNFGHFHSALLQYVAIVFMFAGALNFALHLVAFRRGSLAAYFQDSEVRALLGLVVAAAAAVALALYASGTLPRFSRAAREALFMTVSFVSTTGYTTRDFSHWPGFVPQLLLMLAFVGGCSGSTTGGVKVVRMVLLFRQGAREVLQLVHPRGRFLVKLGGLNVPGSVLAAVTGFCTFYLACYVVMSMAVSSTGVDTITAWSAVASCLNNLGPALGAATHDYLGMNALATWILSFAMILGRLEVFTLLVLLTPAFWRE